MQTLVVMSLLTFYVALVCLFVYLIERAVMKDDLPLAKPEQLLIDNISEDAITLVKFVGTVKERQKLIRREIKKLKELDNPKTDHYRVLQIFKEQADIDPRISLEAVEIYKAQMGKKKNNTSV